MSRLEEVLRSKKVKWKLGFMSQIMIGISVFLGVGALIGAFELNSRTRELSENWMVANSIISELDYLTSEFRLKQYHHIVSDTEKEYQQVEAEAKEVHAKILQDSL